jgi:UDP-glucose 4-epimerase
LNKILDGKDIVFHLAGQPSVHNSWGDNFQSYSNRNIVLTQKLLRAAVEVQSPKFINSSSSSIYGRVESTSTVEGDEKRPISPYGVTKLAAENLVTLFGSEFGLNSVSLRYFTVYGPRQRPDMAFNKLISAGLTGNTFQLHGDGTQTRDFTFVVDVCKAFLAAAQSNLSGEVMNVGSGNTYSVNELVRLLDGPAISIPKRPGEPDCTFADITKIMKSLDWAPIVNLENGVKIMLENIHEWKDAPLWDSFKIEMATKSWFKYLGDKSKSEFYE